MFWNILKHVHRYNLECSKGRNKLALLTPIQLNHKCKLLISVNMFMHVGTCFTIQLYKTRHTYTYMQISLAHT